MFSSRLYDVERLNVRDATSAWFLLIHLPGAVTFCELPIDNIVSLIFFLCLNPKIGLFQPENSREILVSDVRLSFLMYALPYQSRQAMLLYVSS